MSDAIDRALSCATPLVAGVQVVGTREEPDVLLHFDPAMVRARAEQQGLKDRTSRAAAADPRVQSLLVAAISELRDRGVVVRRCRVICESGLVDVSSRGT